MSQVIRISNELYKRLEALASGFDTPSNVIEAVLNAYESNNPSPLSRSINSTLQPAANLDLVYLSGSEEKFKQELLSSRKAYIKLYFTNNSSEIKEWNISKFDQTSNVASNLRGGYLRDWKKRGIFKAELSINQKEFI